MAERNPLLSLLADPEVMEAARPLVTGIVGDAVTTQLAEVNAKVDNLAEGLRLIAQSQYELAQAAQPAPPGAQPAGPAGPPGEPPPMAPPMPQGMPQAMSGPMEPGGLPTAPSALPTAPGGAIIDRLAPLIPLAVQYFTQQRPATPNLGSIAETMNTVTAISNLAQGPFWQGIDMAVKLFSLTGRSGIEPAFAAEKLGDIVAETKAQQNAETNPATDGHSTQSIPRE